MDLVEDMYERGFFEEEIKQIKGEEDKEVKFRLVFNGDFDIMQRTRKSTRTMSYLQDIAPIIQVVGQDALNANDWFKMMQDIETANGVDNYLCTEEEYNTSVQGRMQGEQIMQQLEAMKLAAGAQGGNGNVGIGTNLPANA
jgi:hypothetical protein